MDRYDHHTTPYYANSEQNTPNVPRIPNTPDSSFIQELEKRIGEKENQCNLNVKQDSPKKNANALIPALRPPPPNIKKSSPSRPEPEMVLSPSGLVTNTWDQTSHCSMEADVRNAASINSWTQQEPEPLPSLPSQITNTWDRSRPLNTNPRMDQLTNRWSPPHHSSVQESTVVRTNVIDINSSSDLFENKTDALTKKLNEMWLDKTQPVVEQRNAYPVNVDMYSSILKKDPWQQQADTWDSPNTSSSTINSFNSVDKKKVKKKKSNSSMSSISSVNSKQLSSLQRHSLSSNVNSTCPTISQAFFKSVNTKQENSYQPLQNGVDPGKRKNVEKNRISSNYVIYQSSPNLNMTGTLDGNISSIKKTHSPLVGLSGELRMRKLEMLLSEMPDAGEEERITALQHTGWDVPAATKCIKLDRLLRLVLG